MLTKSLCVLACVGAVVGCGGRHAEATAAPITLPSAPSARPTALRTTSPFEGRYTLDRERTKDALVQETAKLPPAEQAFARLGMPMIDMMDVSLEIASGGVAKLQMTVQQKEDEQTTTWTTQDDTLVLSNGKGKAPTICKKDVASLTCVETRASGRTTMVFQAQ